MRSGLPETCGGCAAKYSLASSSEAVTNEYLRRILKSVDSLEVFPERFPEWRYDESLRVMPVEKYCVFFRVVRETVRIVHVRYAGRKPYRKGC